MLLCLTHWHEVNKVKRELQPRSKTSQLWLQYQDMLLCARSLIMADCTGSWRMHLQAVTECLPIFTATAAIQLPEVCILLFTRNARAGKQAPSYILEICKWATCSTIEQHILGWIPPANIRYQFQNRCSDNFRSSLNNRTDTNEDSQNQWRLDTW